MDNQKLINFLNQLLSNHFVMYVKLHRYHWFVQGRHFFQLHKTFEEMYEKIAEDLDEVAERILAIDGKPLAVMSKYLEETTLVEANADDKEDEIIDQLMEDYKQIISEIKEIGIPLANEQKDEPTADLLIGLQASYEKYVWMLTAYRAYK
ncbi:DNA starvation/stationary phase protection protein [Ornithinibacillus sp. L9]|uniref:DNA starvation/stationary phase protection protein n=1 Tax=Ornithinibacillus caprae TaxID=2678566 RepID=A0A6N8FPU5_9BACI|nr:DNA starvation/stationary phase protection protein [Ornithinibacillus caprae]MUK90724.1 DNA starvation/stationary phase protection protein [Ornithinibacillus caprae]